MVAQSTRKYSNEFLNIGVDASALGMSNAVVASSNDVNSGYWNPAGLVHLEDSEAAPVILPTLQTIIILLLPCL